MSNLSSCTVKIINQFRESALKFIISHNVLVVNTSDVQCPLYNGESARIAPLSTKRDERFVIKKEDKGSCPP